jgi:hypothetical protein
VVRACRLIKPSTETHAEQDHIKSIVSLLLLPPAQTPTLNFGLSTRRLKQFLTRKSSKATPKATALPAIDLVEMRTVINNAHSTNPLPDPAHVARAALPDHRTDVGIRLDLLLHLLPQLLAARSREFVAQDVVAQLSHADVFFVPGDGVLDVQGGLLVELLQREAGELLGLDLGIAVAGDAAAGVEGAGG